MFIELVDALRCPNAHEDSWLVASAQRMEERHIVEGTLGCPVCAAEFPIHQGVVDFRSNRGAVTVAGMVADTELAMRVAALLDLADARGFAVLTGAWGALAPELAAIVETPLIVIDPPEGITGMPGISVLRCDGALPIATSAARAVALDGGSAARIRSAVRAAKTKGRVIGEAGVTVPEGITELARDDRMWVGEREAVASPLVSLHVRRG